MPGPARGSLTRFIAAELAPLPGRARATLRIVVACVVSAAITAGFHIPEGQWAITTIFTVSQADAGASLKKAIQRVVATVVGGMAGIVTVVLFADQPWLRVPALGLLGATGLFLSRTTTAPYVGLLGGFTALLIVAAARGGDPSAAVNLGLWRMVLITFGVVIGAGAQLWLWPDDPEEELLRELAARLDTAAGAVGRVLGGTPRPDASVPTGLTEAGLVHHLDLLTNAEARYPSLRLRHVEQIALIGGVEQLLTAAFVLERAAAVRPRQGDRARRRLAGVQAACERLRDAIAARRPAAAETPAARDDEDVAAQGDVRLLPAILEMERTIALVADATGFLANPRGGAASPPAVARTPLDTPQPAGFLTPACSWANTSELAFALKGGLAASICDLLVAGFAWPGIQTSIWTTILVAQTNQGAIVQKALLRLVGATLGGLLGALAIVTVIPNLENLTSFLVVVAIGSACAAWLSTGSARIAYAGFQVGLAFGLTLVDASGPTTSLIVPRDRVLGVLLGNAVAAVVYLGFGHARARDAMTVSMGATLRELGALVRVGLSGEERPPELGPTRGHRFQVYQNLLATLRLRDESSYEPGATRPEVIAARDRVLRLVGDAQALLLAVLALVRHRLDLDLRDIPDAVRGEVRPLAIGIGETLDAAAERLAGRPAPLPDLRALVVRAERALASPAAAGLDPHRRAHLEARLGLYRDVLLLLDRLTADIDVPLEAPARVAVA